ncbi:MAG: FtsQ-type POTRA domain-containing protein [Alphaproteobacteria bacterium]|nr:FtsQ-type POTRA domain-containing protein [Alphaproteobacteria bacterium]
MTLALFAATLIFTLLLALDAQRLRRVAGMVPQIEDALVFAGFGLDQVSLKGNRFAFAADIFEALKLDKAKSVASFNTEAARTRLEALPWIAEVQFRRVWPNQLEVLVKERKTFAVWDDGKALQLIDAAGRVLARVDEARAPKDLPRFAGAGAGEKALAFWRLVGQHPEIAKRFSRARRYGRRRWSVELGNGIVIHLPAEGEAGALAGLAAWPAFRGILENGNAIVDVRAQGRIAVRATNEVGRTSSRPETIADLIDPAG